MTAPDGADSIELSRPVFISDLHLAQDRPRTLERFLQLIETLGGRDRQLVILGDLFEYWLGDDEAADGIGATVSAALRSLSARGTSIYLMQGNRDVLLGQSFASACGAVLLNDPCRARVAGVPTLLSHGDAWCTLDMRYQAYRRRARSRFWQRLFLGRSLALRRALARRMRAISESGKRSMPAPIMDVTPSAVEQAFRGSGVLRIIHGHTHRPGLHRLQLDGQTAERWVLTDWDFDAPGPPRGGYLRTIDGHLEAIVLA